jgi:hypothetical protein
MFNNKKLYKILFGRCFSISHFDFDKSVDTQFNYGGRKFTWRNDDGLLVALLERIEALENKLDNKKP